MFPRGAGYHQAPRRTTQQAILDNHETLIETCNVCEVAIMRNVESRLEHFKLTVRLLLLKIQATGSHLA